MAALLLAILCALLCLAAGQSSACPSNYQYTQQPPEFSFCNPYEAEKLRLDCAIVGVNVTQIQWFFSESLPPTMNTVALSNSDKYVLNNHTEGLTTGVQLTVLKLTEQDMGFYWCQGIVTDGLLSMSNAFELLNQMGYLAGTPCMGVIRNSNVECARFSLTTTPPPLSTTLPPPTTQLHVITTPPPLQTPVLITTEKAISTASNTETTSKGDTGTEHQPITDFTTDSLFSVQNGDSDIILYAVLGLVGFLGVICCALGVVIILLCRKKWLKDNVNGSENKNLHLSSQSDFALLSDQDKLPSPSVLLYQPESSQHMVTGPQRRDLSGDYAEIGPALIMSNDTLQSLHSSYPGPRTPPPLPCPHPRFTAFHSNLEMGVEPHDITGYENPYDLPIHSDRGPEQINSGAQSQTYHILERNLPPLGQLSQDRHSPAIFSDTSSFSTPPESPPHYQTLGCPPCTAPTHPLMPEYVGTVNPLEYSYEPYSSRLETIPEHPYHVLERETDGSVAAVHTQAGMDRAESTDDELEYDRLIGPPHLYQILEHSTSTNKPKIHQFQFGDYNTLESPLTVNQETNEQNLTVPSHSPELHVTTQFSLSDSSTDNEVFSDPQTDDLLERSVDQPSSTVQTCTHGRPPTFLHPFLIQPVDLFKYSGDYERDPSYMQRLHSTDSSLESPKLLLPSPNFTGRFNLMSSQDDSGFCLHTAQPQKELRRQSSLPNIPHIYQALQARTMDPPLPYERIIKKDGQSIETNP